jgi:hypothetical protein
MNLFIEFMIDTRDRLAVCTVWFLFLQVMTELQVVKGQIPLTCDAWSANNGDGYFVVTAHWIDESSDTWTMRMAIIGFICMMKSHSGIQMRQALFKVCKQVGIETKVCEGGAGQ